MKIINGLLISSILTFVAVPSVQASTQGNPAQNIIKSDLNNKDLYIAQNCNSSPLDPRRCGK